jgi:uncharacterized membrane protein YoaK (UPF0700 family)
MDERKALKKIALVIFCIFFLNFLGGKFYWYYSIWYFDIIMHTLGGFWIALLIFFLFFRKKEFIFSFKNIIIVLLLVFVVGILWEFFEILVNETIAQNPFNLLDTVSDIFCDLSGALISFFFYKNIFRKKENKL